MRRVRFGIQGCGKIARQLATALIQTDGVELVAVAARDALRAEEFGREFGAAKSYGSYDALLADSEVDVVYIATPHNFHHKMGLAALSAGKGVMCEKPICTNAIETRELIDSAKRHNVFLMEAMWTRFNPLVRAVAERIFAGEFGELRLVRAEFGFRDKLRDPKGRMLNPDLAGGVLLDLGIYPLSLIHMLLGKPSSISGVANVGETGVDEHSAFMFSYDDGAIGFGACSMQTKLSNEARIYLTDGEIVIHAPFWNPSSVSFIKTNQEPEVMRQKAKINGYEYEIAAVKDALLNGDIEHPVMPLAASLQLSEIMDELRESWGVRYPWEM